MDGKDETETRPVTEIMHRVTAMHGYPWTGWGGCAAGTPSEPLYAVRGVTVVSCQLYRALARLN